MYVDKSDVSDPNTVCKVEFLKFKATRAVHDVANSGITYSAQINHHTYPNIYTG